MRWVRQQKGRGSEKRDRDEVQKPLCSPHQQEVNHLVQIYGNLMRNVVFILLLISWWPNVAIYSEGRMNVSNVRYFTETKDVTPAGLDSSTGDHECSALTVTAKYPSQSGTKRRANQQRATTAICQHGSSASKALLYSFCTVTLFCLLCFL